MTMDAGTEWIVDASGCDPGALRSIERLEELFRQVIRDLELTPVTPCAWHQFPGAGGITGVVVLSESHLTCHTFPERGYAALNLYCCRPRAAWPWEARLRETLGAGDVSVHTLRRGTRATVSTDRSGASPSG